jgi:hypothetical protein
LVLENGVSCDHGWLIGGLYVKITPSFYVRTKQKKQRKKGRKKEGKLQFYKRSKVHPCTGTEALYRPYGP